MELAPNVAARIAMIRTDEVHGASWLSRQALGAVALCAAEAPADTADRLRAIVQVCLEAAATARPEMIPIRRWVERLTRAIDDLPKDFGDLAALRAAIVAKTDELIALSEDTNRRSVDHAVARLSTGSSVFTASYSQTVVDAICIAGRSGKLSRLVVAESVDPSGHVYGRLLADAVGDAVPSVEVVPDADIAQHVAGVDRVWLGADTILPDGSLLNGTPSLALAREAHAARSPVELIGESAKIDFPVLGATVRAITLPPGPAGMERVPSEFIDVMIAEDGPIYWPLTPLGNASAAELTALIAERLTARHETVAVVESGAGGRIGDLMTDRPGSSAWFAGSLVAYSNDSKIDVAGVPAEFLAKFGAVSGSASEAFALAAVGRFGTTWGVGETGIAGPQTNRRSAKPAGLVHVTVAGPDGLRAHLDLVTHHDNRAANKQEFALAALRLLAETIVRAERGE